MANKSIKIFFEFFSNFETKNEILRKRTLTRLPFSPLFVVIVEFAEEHAFKVMRDVKNSLSIFFIQTSFGGFLIRN